MREGEKSWPGDCTRTEYLPSYSRQLAIPHRPGPHMPSLWRSLLPSRAPRAAHQEPACGVWLGRPRANMPQLSHRQFLSLNSDPIRHFLFFRDNSHLEILSLRQVFPPMFMFSGRKTLRAHLSVFIAEKNLKSALLWPHLEPSPSLSVLTTYLLRWFRPRYFSQFRYMS